MVSLLAPGDEGVSRDDGAYLAVLDDPACPDASACPVVAGAYLSVQAYPVGQALVGAECYEDTCPVSSYLAAYLVAHKEELLLSVALDSRACR